MLFVGVFFVVFVGLGGLGFFEEGYVQMLVLLYLEGFDFVIERGGKYVVFYLGVLEDFFF